MCLRLTDNAVSPLVGFVDSEVSSEDWCRINDEVDCMTSIPNVPTLISNVLKDYVNNETGSAE